MSELEPLREAVRELAAVVADQQRQLDELRAAFDCIGSPAAVAQCLAVFDALKAGREPTAPVVQDAIEDPYAWL